MIPSKGISPNLISVNQIKQPIDNTKGSKSSYIVSYTEQKKFISSSTPFEVPTQASRTYESINDAKLGDTENPYEDKSFSEIREETRNIYDANREFERGAGNFNYKYNSMKNDAEKNKLWKELNSIKNELSENRNTVDGKKDLQSTDQYKNLKNRVQLSLLEGHLSGSPLSTKLDPMTGVFRDPQTGLYADLIPLKDTSGKVTGDYALCFGSTGIGHMTAIQTKVDIDQVLNEQTIPAAYQQAADLAATLIKELNIFGAEITVTGQSMGGGIANYVGLKLGINSVCYNPAALGPAAIKDLKDDGRLTADNLSKQKIIRQKGDIISGEKNQKKIALLANLFSIKKIKRPQHLGQIYVANKSEAPSLNGVTRGFQFRHFTSSFDHFYYPRTTPAAQPTTPSTNSDASSESSSTSSPSGGE